MTSFDRNRLFSSLVLLTGARVTGALSVFATTFLITRLLGADTMAQFSVYLAVASLLSVILPCGFHAIGSMIAAEYQAQGRHDTLRSFIRYGQRLIATTGLIAVSLASLVIYFLPDDSAYDFGTILIYAVPSAVGMAFIYFNGNILIGLQRPFFGQVPDILIRPVLLLSTVGFIAISMNGVAIWKLLLASTLVFGVTALIQWLGLLDIYRSASKTKAAPQTDRKHWWRIAPNWTVITLLWDYFIEIHILIASLLFAPFEVALFHICFRIRQLAGFGMKALYSLLIPKVFSANANQADEKTQELVRFASRTTLAYALAAWIGIALVGPFLLGLFGQDFVQGHTILLIIMGSLPIRALFGPAPAVLGMKRHQKRVMQILLLSLVLSLGLTLTGYQVGGLTIVAWAYLAATTMTAIAMWASAKRKSGIDCAAWA